MQRGLGRIQELSTIEDIEQLETLCLKENGIRPNNVSYWNPSPCVSRKMEKSFIVCDIPSAVDYIFSYELGVSDKLLALVGLESGAKGVLVTPSGSTSILMVARYLSKLGVNQVTLLGPGYFTVPANLRAEGVDVQVSYLVRTDEGYCLPTSLDLNKVRVLWVTNPVYCTGVSYFPSDIQRFRQFLSGGGIIICDECLAWGGAELCRELGQWPGFIGIYSPHKGLCTNGIKYSFIVLPHEVQNFFNDWADALYGCLPASSVVAINHSLSLDFKRYRELFKCIVDKARDFVVESATTNEIDVDWSTSGYLITCYAKHVWQSKQMNVDFMKNLIIATSASFIPGIRNHFDPDIGLCFRVNLARDDAAFRGALTRVFHYLHDLR